MTIAALRTEFESVLIGEQIYGRVGRLVRQALKRRDPRVYAHGAHDARDAVEDVLNDFVLEVLIGERQIDYVMTTAVDLDEFDRLMQFQLNRHLARRRIRTVADNLIDRAVDMFGAEPFASESRADGVRYRLMGEPSDGTRPTDGELRLAVAMAQQVPKTRANGSERAPRVYGEDALRSVLTILLRNCSGSVAREDLQRFFELLLTSWLPSFLDPDEHQTAADADLGPEEAAIAEETTERLMDVMTDEQRLILAYKHANLPDRALAERLGLSRQSVAPRKDATFALLREALEGSSTAVQSAVLRSIAVQTAEGMP